MSAPPAPIAAPAWRQWAPTLLILLVAALPRLWIAWADQSIFWPDEIYQSLEPAHFLAFGYGATSWEFELGGRSWLFPGLLAAWIKLLSLVGFDRAAELVVGAKMLMAAISVLGIYGAMRLARALAGPTAGWLAGLFAAGFPLLLLFGSRCMGETVSGTLLVFVALALVRRGRYDAWLAGALGGVTIFLRYPNGLVLIGFGVMLAAAHRGEDLRRFVLAGLAAGWAGGLLDWLTWGSPFHSVIVNLRYNMAYQDLHYGEFPADFFLASGWTSTGPVLAVLALGLLAALRRSPGLVLTGLAYIAVHSLITHKEMRFLLPVLPLLLALAAVGLVRLLETRLSTSVTTLLAAVLALALAQRATALTFADVGQFQGEPAGAVSPWHAAEGVNRLLWVAGQQPDLCGMWVTGIRPAWAAAYAYLHRLVPLIKGELPGNGAYANYAAAPLVPEPWPIAWDPPARLPPEFVAVAQSRGWVLYRRDGECRALDQDPAAAVPLRP